MAARIAVHQTEELLAAMESDIQSMPLLRDWRRESAESSPSHEVVTSVIARPVSSPPEIESRVAPTSSAGLTTPAPKRLRRSTRLHGKDFSSDSEGDGPTDATAQLLMTHLFSNPETSPPAPTFSSGIMKTHLSFQRAGHEERSTQRGGGSVALAKPIQDLDSAH